jgi:hypothetical protein
VDAARARLLFVPVSGPRGAGEYARVLAIANEAARRWPGAGIHFVVSSAAPYADSVPFPATLVPSSPTYHSREVADTIAGFRPTLTIFDNAGRTQQIEAARRAGSRIVYVSSRVRQRRKAFRLRWMRMLDEHWIAYPEFVAGPPGPIEGAKLRLLGRPVLRYLDALLPPVDAERARGTLSRFGLQAGEYVLVVPGGGTAHRGAENAPAIVAEAAARIASRGRPTLLVGIADPGVAEPRLQSCGPLPVGPFSDLLRNAGLVVSNGGDTMLQALACGRACIAVPIAGDQQHRIDRCAQQGVVVSAPLEAQAMERHALALLGDPALRDGLAARLAGSGITDGMETVMSAIERLHAR